MSQLWVGLVCMFCTICASNAQSACTEGSVRLVDGAESSPYIEGRVEYCSNGVWGTVCNNQWDALDATVVCRQLGLNEIDSRVASFSAGTGSIWLDRVACTGNEERLADCPSDVPPASQRCSQAGVRCQPRGEICTEEGAIRLAGSSSAQHMEVEGRVEFCSNGVWGTVCGNGWDALDATVVCRQLGLFTFDSRTYTLSSIQQGTGSIWLDSVACLGSEMKLADCPSTQVRSSCTHYNDARVRCQTLGDPCTVEGSTRLIGGASDMEGRVEYCNNGRWGTVCNRIGWDSLDAMVVCRELGHYALDARPFPLISFREGTGHIWLASVTCTGTEMRLADCLSDPLGDPNCRHHHDAHVHCWPQGDSCSEEQSIRLVGGASELEGRVEYCNNGFWGTVCRNSWTAPDATVVCRQLGHNAIDAQAFSFLGQGSGSVWPDTFDCTGTEMRLADCPTIADGGSSCNHNRDASVQCQTFACTPEGSIRLVGGTTAEEGRVHICYNGVWSTVCQNTFDVADATVVCRQLGHSEASPEVIMDSSFPEGTGNVWLDNVGCTGTEEKLVDCPFNTVGNNSCGHSEDASVRCAVCTDGSIRLAGRPRSSLYIEGRVEYCSNRVWGTVCHNQWNVLDATVVCRQLGLNTFDSQARRSAYFGEGTGNIFLDGLTCTGTEMRLADCPSNQLGGQNCAHSQDAGVQCQPRGENCTEEGSIRLAGSRSSQFREVEGYVEFCSNGVWGTVCRNGWGILDATVVCRELGHFTFDSRTSFRGSVSRRTGSMWLQNVACVGTEMRLADCPADPADGQQCTHHYQDARVHCQRLGDNCTEEGSIRLIGAVMEGRVEYCHNGRWGTVCHNGWDTLDAMVVCRQLGHNTHGARALTVSYSRQGTGHIWLDGIKCTGTEMRLADCPSNPLGGQNCRHTQDASIRCWPQGDSCSEEQSIRLVGGASELEGRVEYCNNGFWSTVCHDHWNIPDATVVCRQLGHNVIDAVVFNGGGGTTGSVWLDTFNCRGTELRLADCPVFPNGGLHCTHGSDASVHCQTFACAPEGSIRLVGGTTAEEGRVHICYNGVWSTVCQNTFDVVDATVVCRQLGHSAVSAELILESPFPEGTGNVWVDNIVCTGSEKRLIDCSLNAIVGSSSCSHSEDASMRCQPSTNCIHGSVRLVSGSSDLEGRVEFCNNGVWGTVCDSGLSSTDAAVICSQLGHGTFFQRFHRAYFGEGAGDIWLHYVSCGRTDRSLIDCRSSTSGCTHTRDVGVRCQGRAPCAPGSIRLVGGTKIHEGRMEVCNNNVWGTVCDDEFGIEDANVACRQLGYSGAVSVHCCAAFGERSGEIVLDQLNCAGTESSLFDCPAEPVGMHNCFHSEDVGVTCTLCTEGSIRLVGGTSAQEGRVEVCNNNAWGTVCDDTFGTQEANVACRQIGFLGTGATVHCCGEFGQGEGEIVLSQVNCVGTESSLFDCPMSSGRCSHLNDVGVTCEVPAGCSPECLNGGTCTEANTCSCPPGRTGNQCQDDVNECSTNNGGCQHDCDNTQGSFTCSCREGFQLDIDQSSCSDINECESSNGGCDDLCANNEGSFTCSCSQGYEFELGDDSDPTNAGKLCQDTNECMVANGNCGHICTNTDGSRECSCEDGYRLESDGQSCPDIDECAERTHNCMDIATCENEVGSFRCTCPAGYDLSASATTCDDVNECEDGFSGGCSQICSNTVGTFQCSCNIGFELGSDGFLCFDIDECALGTDNCDQRCVNTEGSFECACSRGFSLTSDGINCAPRQCPTLLAPLNGRMEPCSNQTGQFCQFSCNTGYMLSGSSVRTCLPTSTWSGRVAMCQPEPCKVLQAPENGAILPPCNNEFSSICTPLCNFGYTLEGPTRQICMLDSNDELVWTETPTCKEVSPCESNPCQNGGVCVPVEATASTSESFQCNCIGTQYEGPTCSRGIVTTPVIPALFVHQLNTFNISARPLSDLNVRLMGRGLQVKPSMITLNRETTSGNFQVTGQRAGHYTLTYQLHGSISDEFEMPDSSPVLVSMNRSDERVNRYFTYQETDPGLIVESCCKPMSLIYSECPMSTNPISFRSSCKWSSAGSRFETPGIVFAENKNLILPLSISGISIIYNGTGEILSGLSIIPVASCTSCASNRGKHLTSKPLNPPDCYFYQFDSGDVEDMLKSNSLAYTFIDRIARLLPSWLSVSILNNEGDSTSFYDIDFATSLVKHEDVYGISGCESIVASDPGLYMVLRYSRGFEVSMDGGSVRHTPIAPTDGNPVCVAVNLCQDVDSPVYLGLPSNVQSIVRLLPALVPYNRDNWQYSLESVTLYSQARNVTIPGMYWNGTEIYLPEMANSDLRMETTATLNLESGLISIELKYEGSASMYFPNEQIRSGYLEGGTELLIKMNISGESSTLVLTSSLPAVAFTDSNEAVSVCNQGLSLGTTYIPRAGQEFFSTLFPLSDVTLQCQMDVILNIDYSLRFHGLSMSLGHGCPMLQLDRLLFTQMDHTLYIHETTSIIGACYQRPVPELVVEDPIMTIHSSLRGASSLSLGRFIRLNQEPDMPAMTTVYSSESVGYVSRLHSATLSVLGTMITSPIELENGVLNLEAGIRAYNLYNTTVRVTAPTDVPWDRQALRVVGELQNSAISEIENSVQTFVEKNIVMRAEQRRDNAERAYRRADEQLTMLEEEYSLRNRTLDQANDSYNEALDSLQLANDILAVAEGALEEASEELKTAQTELDNVCSENDCEDVVVSQTRCTMCFENVYTTSTFECYEPQVRQELVLQRVFPDRMYNSWEFVTCCFETCRYETQAIRVKVCSDVCRGVCKLVTRSEPVYGRRPLQIIDRVRRNCVGQNITGQRIVDCCSEVTVPVENTDCKEECRNSRQAAVQGLQRSRAELAAPFQKLENARSMLAASRATLTMETLNRDSALEMRDQLTAPIATAKTARDISNNNRRKVLEELEKELRLAEQVNQGMDQRSVFRIIRANFSILIDSTSPTQVPMMIEYESSALELTREVIVIFDFVSPQEINLRRLTEVIVADMLNTTSLRARRSASRSRRQVGELEFVEKSSTQMEFEANCADHSVLVDFVDQLMRSLNDIRENNEEAKGKLDVSIAALRAKMEEQNRAHLNLDTLRDFFNVSRDDFGGNSPEPESSDYKEYLQQLIKIATDTIRSIDSSSFAMWQASTELLYNEIDSILGNPCSGYADCLEVVVDIAESLVNDLPASAQKIRLTEEFEQSSLKFLTIATSMNLSLPDAIDTIAEFSILLQADVVSNYWCSSLPDITLQPPPRVNVSLGGDLVLNCSANSSLPVSVHWRKNGVPIPSANSYTFTLTGAQMLDSGNYTCVVTNAVGSSESLLTNVTVFELPEFFSVLEPVTTMVGNDSGAWFACNASGFPYPGWRWHFRSDLSQPWTEIAGEDTNELTISSPQFRDQGWYTCEAFNDHGFKRAEGVYLTVLPRTVSQFSLGVRFGLHLSDNSDDMLEDCSAEDVDRIISEYLSNQIELGRASVDSLSVSYDSNNTEFAVSFSLLSADATDRRIDTVSFEQIQNRALPSRGDVIRLKEFLQGAFSRDEVSFTCNIHQLVSSDNSLTFDVPAYRCPEGQELSSDFLFCVSCATGSYPVAAEAVRVFNGRGYKERYSTCQACPAGTYSDEIGMSSCRRCPTHHQTRFQGSSSEQDCFVDPLLLECNAEGSGNEVTIGCQTNRPPAFTLCSFDGGLTHKCTYPIVISRVRNNLSPGAHVLSFSVRDDLGYTAETFVNYELSEERIPSNTSSMVPQLGVHFINRSPRVSMDRVEADFVLTRPVASITCQLQGVNNTQRDCSSGNVMYSDLPPGRHYLRVAAINFKKEDRAIVRRRFDVPPSADFCLLHLVDDGLVVDERSGNVTIDFDGVGPVESFMCALDGNLKDLVPCTTPVMYSGLTTGHHSVLIDPQGCQRKNRRRVRYKFVI